MYAIRSYYASSGGIGFTNAAALTQLDHQAVVTLAHPRQHGVAHLPLHGEHVLRITSYNVCYTKLLRGLEPTFNTPSGKIELYSQQMKDAGMPPSSAESRTDLMDAPILTDWSR